MVVEDKERWPSHLPPDIAPLLQAIGVIALTFSALERSLDDHYLHHASRNGLDYDSVSRIYLSLPREKKLDELRYIFERFEDAPDITASIKNLIDCFRWCSDLRNLVLHSEFYPSTFGEKSALMLSKRGKNSVKSGYTKLSLSLIRSRADFVHASLMLSAEIDIHIRYKGSDVVFDPLIGRLKESLPKPLTPPRQLKVAEYPYLLDTRTPPSAEE